MRRIFAVFLISFFLFSCGAADSEIKEKYIKTLEEKNSALQEELKACQSNQVKTKGAKSSKAGQRNSSDYFTIGSTEEEVLDVMGDPDNLLDLGIGGKVYTYEGSRVTFEDGKVKSYSNYGRNLKVRVKK